MSREHRYTVERLLGEGGSGQVLLVSDRLLAGRRVALKRLNQRADDLLRSTFEREFAALASLSLPGVARVFDFGLTDPEDGRPGAPFFTRAYVPGRRFDEAGLPFGGLLRVFVEACRITGALHQKGVIHGDLKPANIIVDSATRPWLIDFGLAQGGATDGEGVGGTPAFMAPELFTGSSPSVATDVYALAATLWSLLVGHAPFEDLGRDGLAARVKGATPDIPDGASEETARVCAALRAGLTADPTKRLPTADELIAQLTRFDQVESKSVGPRPFVAPRPRGHRELLADLDQLTQRGLSNEEIPDALLLRGAPGAGKSVLLRELKWRLQLRGVQVIEVAGRVESTFGPLESIIAHAYLEPGEPAIPEGVDTAKRATEALRWLASRRPTVVLVDDLDRAEPVLGRCLRLALHSEEGGRLALVMAATEARGAVRDVGHYREVAVPLLSLPSVDSLVRDVLGEVDDTVTRAFFERSGGNPRRLLDLLAAVAVQEHEVATASDVLEVSVPAGAAEARVRISRVTDATRRLLILIAGMNIALTREMLEQCIGEHEDAVEEALASGLIEPVGDTLEITDASLRAVLEEMVEGDAAKGGAQKLLNSTLDLSPLVRSRLAQVVDDGPTLTESAPAAIAELKSSGAYAAAAGLLESLAKHLTGSNARRARFELADLELRLGHFDRARESAQSLVDDPSTASSLRFDASLLTVKALAKTGAVPQAIQILEQVAGEGSPSQRVAVFREQARLELARSDLPAADAAAKRGLDLARSDDASRPDLLAVAAMVATYRGDHAEARRLCREGIDLARSRGNAAEEAHCEVYLAIDHHRAGELVEARDLYEQALSKAQEAGDLASIALYTLNLGTVCDDLGERTAASRHYQTASRLSRRAGVISGDIAARCNLAHVHTYLGLYERAGAEARSAREDADRFDLEAPAAQATVLMAEVAARQGDVDEALARYDDGLARYRRLRQPMEIAEVLLDVAEVLLDRGGVVDGAAAASRLADARSIVEDEQLDALQPLLTWLLARARSNAGDAAKAIADLEALLESRSAPQDLRWRVLFSLTRLNARRGADFMASRHHVQAMEILESIATALPGELRDAFWRDPRRGAVRRWSGSSVTGVSMSDADGSDRHGGEMSALALRSGRLLELIKRLASEHDVDRLLERINDSAVELAGAERGFVLLVDDDGRLSPRTVSDSARALGGGSGDPHVAFSRSIAEAVLIDGEPIVTVDARDDRRVSEYLSVHKLMLKSVACLPIRGRKGTVGVLYLEHRVRRGRFAEADMDLLFAFADQAAIALENARLLRENEARRLELEGANEELQAAKAEIERVLAARTVELEEAKREVVDARRDLRERYSYHGLIGTSPEMRRVFSLVDRVRETSVPVVLYGESGTGKELVARAIHRAGSRATAPFVAVNCGAIPSTLLESSLFGHVRGAFTGADRDRRGFIAQASGGTLFLDEITDMPPKMQVDLLRVLQDGKVRALGSDVEEDVDVRIISASNRQLSDEVSRGSFREDLYYRLQVVEIELPPLRDRKGDLRLLADHFLRAFAARDQTRPKRLTREALARLENDRLPGNVRQLEHVLLNAWVLVDGDWIDADDLSLTGRERPGEGSSDDAFDASQSRSDTPPPQTVKDHKETEKQRILEALEAHGWNRARAAKALDMPRRTFYRRLKEYDVL